MKFHDKAAVRAGSNSSGISPKAAGEIDLYDELVAFVKLSPGEKLRNTNRPGTRSSTDTTRNAAPQPVETVIAEQADIKAVDPESAVIQEVSKQDDGTGQASPQAADECPGTRLDELNPKYVFTNALSGQACRTCGAQSEADDLFCMSCGAFLNGVGSALPFDPNCTDCSRDIQPDEIFCPWCGSTLSDS